MIMRTGTRFAGLLIILVANVIPWALPAATRTPGCSPAGPPQALGGSLDSPQAKFQWESDAGSIGDGMTCFDRLVRNSHTSDKLIFDWLPGNMRSFEGLPPGREYRYNADLPAEYETRNGPLYYGAKGSSVPTAVYREKEAMSSRSPSRSNANYTLSVRDPSGRLQSLAFSISTSFSTIGGFTYTITNRGADTVFLVWTSQVDEFDAALLQYKKARPEFSFDVDAGLKIPPGREVAFILRVSPGIVRTAMVKRTGILIYSADRKPLALVPYPGLFPPPR